MKNVAKNANLVNTLYVLLTVKVNVFMISDY